MDDQSQPGENVIFKPRILRHQSEDDKRYMTTLLDHGLVDEVIDALPEAIEDLFKIDFPFIPPPAPEFQKTLVDFRNRYCDGREEKECGVWVYYPWRRILVHIPDEADYFKLRTARNKYLILPDEQERFYHSRIGIAGLSVGSSVVNAIVLSGGGKHLSLADFDTLSITNLNRLHASVCDLGRSKSIGAARRVYELNPFQEVALFNQGITSENIDSFFGTPETPIQLFIEEMDDIKLKIDTRFKARELKIPVIMATDNGDNTLLDVERFDLEPDRPLFHGKVSEEVLRNTSPKPSLVEKVRLADRIVGPDVTPRMQQSLQMVGTKLPAWPQLGNAAILSGAATSYVARRILNGDPMPSGRYAVSFDETIDPDFDSPAAVESRAIEKHNFMRGFQLIFGTEG